MTRSLQVLHPLAMLDHCCLKLTINTQFEVPKIVQPKINKMAKFEKIPLDVFKLKAETNNFQQRLNLLVSNIQTLGPDNSSQYVDEFNTQFLELSKPPSQELDINKSRKSTKRKPSDKPKWYDAECKSLKNSLNRASKHLARNKFDNNAKKINSSTPKRNICLIAKNVQEVL